MTNQDLRDFLERMAAEEPTPFLDAAPLTRRARRRAARTVVVGAIGVAAAIAVLFAGVAQIRSTSLPADDPTPTPARSEDLGIFAPVEGRIVYEDQGGIWGVDPARPADPATRVQLTSEAGTPLGWSSDGTRLLIMREFDNGGRREFHLFVIHADGSETQVTERPMGWITGATISPDGSRVVFAGLKAIYGVDAGGGRPAELLESQGEVWAPTFSPDGTQIAYVDGSGDHSHRVWLMDADGSDAHEILANATTMGAGHVYGLAWSPAGDRIAFGNDVATYTFGTDGSGFTEVIANGNRPSWSPDGSQLAYIIPGNGDDGLLAIANADGSDARELGVMTSSGPWTSGPWHPSPRGGVRIPMPTPTQPVSSEHVLHLQSWIQDGPHWQTSYVELAVYADGRVIWVPGGQEAYLQMRLTPEGVERLRARAVSTGLFEHDLALGHGRHNRDFGHLEVRRGDRSVIVGWGKTPTGVSGLGMQDRFVDATPAQADELTRLEAFFRDPVTWAVPPDMYLQPDASPFVPTHLWVSWDRSVPDPSELPSPAREVLTSNLEAVLDGRCEVISIAQAEEIAQAMEQAGLIESDDVTDGIAFDMPGRGSPSFFHAHPALPHESTCD